MPRLEIPDNGTIADKNHGTEIIIDGYKNIEQDTTIQFEDLDGVTLTVDGFYEIETDAPTWVHLHNNDASDDGVYGIDLFWRELAERVAYGNAEILQ
jgi:hypothetical protein